MLVGELVTITRYRLPIKVVVKNGTFGQIKWEQMMFLGNPETECDLTPIDFALVAEACGIRAWRVADPAQCAAVVAEAFDHPGATLIEATVDPNEPLLPPKRNETYVENMGTPGADAIREALAREPSRSMLKE